MESGGAGGAGHRSMILYRDATTWSRLDVTPFILLYGAALVATISAGYDYLVVLAAVAVIGLLQVLTFLFCQWFLSFKCFIQKKKVC